MTSEVEIDIPPDPALPGSGYTEKLPARRVADGLFELQSHSQCLPLGPGDAVRTASVQRVQSVDAVSEGWIIDVLIKSGHPDDATYSLAAYWQRDVPVTVTSYRTMRLSSVTKEWVDVNVVSNPLVLAIEVVRRPGQAVELSDALAALHVRPKSAEPAPVVASAPGSTDYPRINECASSLGRALTIFQMYTAVPVPGILLASQAESVARAAQELSELLFAHLDAEVTIDPRLPEGLEALFTEGIIGVVDVPDTLPEDWPSAED